MKQSQDWKEDQNKMIVQNKGADIQARSIKPSIDLATLLELLAKAIPASSNERDPDKLDPKNRPAILFDPQKKRLKLCTSAVLRRLFGQPNFTAAFNPNGGNGFLQNFQMPAFGTGARMGGALAVSNGAALRTAVDRLIAAIDREIEGALPAGTPLSSLLLDHPEQQLKQLAKAADTSFKDQANSANLVPLVFQTEGSQSTRPDTVVAKVISAIERIDANDYFERMCCAASEHMKQRELDEEEIESALESLSAEQGREDSQVTRFLNFLDDEALSRVRLSVTFCIMEAIAENAQTVNQPPQQLLVEYVSRVIDLFETAKEVGYTVDLTAHYGVSAEFDLLEYLSKATFYSCLPVWAEWKTQIFEEKFRNQTATSYGVAREVSYRFRVNGNNPEKNKPAFEARLDEIERELLSTEETSRELSGRFGRRLAELIFLATVVPQDSEISLNRESLANTVHQLLATLKTNGKEAVNQILQDLRGRAKSMQSIANALVLVLRTKSHKVITQAQTRSAQQFICVKRGVIQWSRLEGADSSIRDLLVGSQQRSREQVEWFKHIEVCNKPEAIGLLFSVKVTTEIAEHNLVIKGDPHLIQVQRLLPKKLLQISWIPFSSEKQQDQWIYKASETAQKNLKGWMLPSAIQIEYDVQTLKRRKEKQDDSSKQYHAAAITAFSVLIYCCLWRIIQQLKASGNDQILDFTTLMLRIQDRGKQDRRKAGNEESGDSYVYAAAQAIETTLAQDVRIRMQGLVLDNIAQPTKSAQYVKAGTFNALLSAFPVAISTPTPPAVPKIGLISYAIRPCDEMPSLGEREKSYLFLSQSYIATAIEHPYAGYELKAERMQADVVDSPERLKKQRLIQEEIRYLKTQGCQHIILLSHAYGSRHINRTADYNSLLTPKEFLEEVFQTFPDLTIYTMLRDVFPATRLRSRGRQEAAFEILRAGDHTNFLQSVEKIHLRNVIPVYTFATLHVVDEKNRPQSGFCVYFLVSDQRVSKLDWTERPRYHLVDPEQQSVVHPCLLTVLRGLHFIEAERGSKGDQLIPVLDPFSWISPTTTEAAGEVEVMHNRRKGRVLLSYPALLSHVSQVLHRRK